MAEQNKFEVEITARIDQLESALKKAEGSIKSAGKAAQSEGSKFSSFADTLSVMNVNFGGLGVNIGAMVTKLRAVSASIKATTIATRGFGVALAATGVGAIVIALGLLISAFLSTQRGADGLNRVMKQFKFAMDAIVGLLQGVATDAFDGLKKAFQDPKQAVIDLWEAIKTNLINRVKGLVDTFTSGFAVIKSAIKLDVEGVKQNYAKYLESLMQVATGVDDLPGKIKKGFDKVKEAVADGLDIGDQIAAAEKELALFRIQNTQELSKQRALLEEGKRISTATSLTLEEQLAGQKQAEAALNRIKSIELQRNKIEERIAELATQTSETLDDTKIELEEIRARNFDIEKSFQTQGKELQANAKRLNDAKKAAEEMADNLAIEKHFQNLDLSEMEEFTLNYKPNEAFEPDDIFLTKEQVEGQKALMESLANQYNMAAQSADVLANSVAGVVSEGFDILFDSSKGFDDFAEVLRRAFVRIIAQMTAAAAKALVLRAIMSAFTGGAGVALSAGATAAGAGVPSLNSVIAQALGAGGNVIRAQDLVRVQNNGAGNVVR
jgi:hypothetical protein